MADEKEISISAKNEDADLEAAFTSSMQCNQPQSPASEPDEKAELHLHQTLEGAQLEIQKRVGPLLAPNGPFSVTR